MVDDVERYNIVNRKVSTRSEYRNSVQVTKKTNLLAELKEDNTYLQRKATTRSGIQNENTCLDDRVANVTEMAWFASSP